MSVARTVAEVIRQHVTLEVESIDRMYLNVYQPMLPSERGVALFLALSPGTHLCLLGSHGSEESRGSSLPSSALSSRIRSR
jgi:hypothetical protein